MRSSFVAVLGAVFGLSATVYAHDALATLSPCPSCPKSIRPEPITITAQYQPVSTCTPHQTCTGKKCHLKPSCLTYDWVSTTIPCLGGATSTVITETDQIVELSHVSTVLTSYSPCATKKPSWKDSHPRYRNESSCTMTSYQTMVVDISAPYDECGPLALGNWGGSGLCKTCVPDQDTKSQEVEVVKCLDGKCSTYAETWVSKKPTRTSSVSTAPFSSAYSCPSGGAYTIPVTAAFTPTDNPMYTAPVTSVFYVTTWVPSPQVVDVTTYVTITFTAEPAPQEISSSLCPTPVITSTYCSENGMHTIPITKTFTPTNPAYTEPVTTTVYYTTSVTNAPVHIECTTTITVIFTTTVCPVQTVVSGTTVTPTAPASTSAGSITSPWVQTSTTPSNAGSSTGGVTSTMMTWTTTGSSSSGSVVASSTTSSGPTGTPSPPTTVGSCDFVGCFGSSDGFAGFSLSEWSGKMTPELCTSECLASGFAYSGLHATDCYCAATLDENCGAEKATGVCDLPCPGNSLEACGGNADGGKKLKRNSAILLDVYECPLPTTTTTSTTETGSSTTSSTPDQSSDPDPEPEKRNIQADMELSPHKPRSSTLLRRGGMLKSPINADALPAFAKRDFGLKKPFGQ